MPSSESQGRSNTISCQSQGGASGHQGCTQLEDFERVECFPVVDGETEALGGKIVCKQFCSQLGQTWADLGLHLFPVPAAVELGFS